MSKSNNSGGGLGFLSILTLIFITLKLTDNIDWSWWWVTAPMWAPIGLLGVLLVILFAFEVIKK